MKTKMQFTITICVAMLVGPAATQGQGLTPQQLAGHGLAAGPARQLLPGSGALLHLQIHDLLGLVEGIEEILVAGIPEKALPPEMQQLLQTEHPLLTLLGMQAVQQPITPEVVTQFSGLDARRALGLTLYLGDPRRMFVLSLPMAAPQPLTGLLNGLLQPSQVEEVRFGDKKALRVVPQGNPLLSELYLVCSDDMLFVCGDRSLAQALFRTPSGERFGQDPFLSRALPEREDKQIRLVVNPAPVKPFAMQLPGLSNMAKMMLPQQRAMLMSQLPQEARTQIEMQIRTQLHVRDLDEFADYVECILLATLDQTVDFITARAVAFEGLTIGAALAGGEIEFAVDVHSQRFQKALYKSALPMADIKKTLAWLGPEVQSFGARGKRPAAPETSGFTTWLGRIEGLCEAKGLKTSFLSRLIKLNESQAPIPTVESQAPWTLTAGVNLNPAPALAKAASLEAYFMSLEGPYRGRITILPDQGPRFLEECFQGEVHALNDNRELNQAFANSFQQQRPWAHQENRFHSTALDRGMMQYVRESAWTTARGIFGYDQHELINRKVVHARRVDDYLIYHSGAKPSTWLAEAKASRSRTIAPATAHLLDGVPEGTNCLSICRVLAGLPGVVDWLAQLEARLHADGEAYLAQAQALADDAADLDAATHAIGGLSMPAFIGNVNMNPETKRVYAMLPAGEAAIVFPRPKVLPLVQGLLAEFAARADAVGGTVTYTKVGSESWAFSTRASTTALTTLTKTVGNALFENYIGTPEKQQQLVKKVSAPRDGDESVFGEVILRNPRWQFMPIPQPKTPAVLTTTLPARAPGTDARLIDLSDHYNGALTETWQAGGMADNTLRDLPQGVQIFGGTAFDVRGVVQLSGGGAVQELSVIFPDEVTGIAVRRRAENLHFLQGCGWAAANGAKIGEYVVHYANGQVRSIPITYGTHVQDWWTDSSGTNMNVAWTGPNHSQGSGSLSVYKMSWSNPLPDLQIATIDYKSAMQNPAPFLIGITAE